MSQYYAIAEITFYGYIPANYYFKSLHSITAEAENGIITGDNDPLPMLTAIPQFSGEGYTNITSDRVLLISIARIMHVKNHCYFFILAITIFMVH